MLDAGIHPSSDLVPDAANSDINSIDVFYSDMQKKNIFRLFYVHKNIALNLLKLLFSCVSMSIQLLNPSVGVLYFMLGVIYL